MIPSPKDIKQELLEALAGVPFEWYEVEEHSEDVGRFVVTVRSKSREYITVGTALPDWQNVIREKVAESNSKNERA